MVKSLKCECGNFERDAFFDWSPVQFSKDRRNVVKSLGGRNDCPGNRILKTKKKRVRKAKKQ